LTETFTVGLPACVLVADPEELLELEPLDEFEGFFDDGAESFFSDLLEDSEGFLVLLLLLLVLLPPTFDDMKATPGVGGVWAAVSFC